MPDPIRLAFLGDLMLGRGVSEELRQRPPEWFWGDTLDIVRAADAVFANLESPITESDARWWKTWKFYRFKADPAAVRILQAGKVRFVSLANNHILDFSEPGLIDTMAALDRAGIQHAGAGRSRAEAAAGRIVEARGMKIGIMAATDCLSEFAAGANRAGANHIEFHGASPGLDWVARSVADLRAQGAALTILSLHWGFNMRLRPSDDFRRFAHGAIDRGVDIIHGHSAHVVQAIERYGKGIVFYDTGNYIDDYWKFPFRRTVSSFVFTLALEDGKPKRLQLTPVRLHPWPLALAHGRTRQAIVANMKSLSAAMGTTLVETPAGLELSLD